MALNDTNFKGLIYIDMKFVRLDLKDTWPRMSFPHLTYYAVPTVRASLFENCWNLKLRRKSSFYL